MPIFCLFPKEKLVGTWLRRPLRSVTKEKSKSHKTSSLRSCLLLWLVWGRNALALDPELLIWARLGTNRKKGTVMERTRKYERSRGRWSMNCLPHLPSIMMSLMQWSECLGVWIEKSRTRVKVKLTMDWWIPWIIHFIFSFVHHSWKRARRWRQGIDDSIVDRARRGPSHIPLEGSQWFIHTREDAELSWMSRYLPY